MVKLALYKGKGTIANAFIRWWSRSPYSHCELVVGNTWYSSSAMDGGVRMKAIIANPDNWDFIDLPWVSEESVRGYFLATDHHRYGWLTLIFSQFLNMAVKFKHAQFCSEWCAAAMGLPNSASLNPSMLGALAFYMLGFHKSQQPVININQP